MTHILVAEDDEAVRQVMVEILELEDYRVTTAVDGLDALQQAIADPPDLVVTDLQMPRLRGDGLIERLHAEGLRMPVIVVTAAILTGRTGPVRIVRKPFGVDDLLDAVRDLLVAAAVAARRT